MIKGIGVDIVDLHRIKKSKDALAKRILTEKEYLVFTNFSSEKRQIEFLGGRFAGKEAYFKAVANMSKFKECEILNDTNGKPYVTMPGVHVSIAHENDYVIAYVIYEELDI